MRRLALAALCLAAFSAPSAAQAPPEADASHAESASADPLLELAASLDRVGWPEEAITEYKRFLFCNPDSPLRAEVLSRLGLLLRERGQTDEAVRAFELAAGESATTGERREYTLAAAATLMGAGRLAAAEFRLASMLSVAATREEQGPVLLYQLYLFVLAHRFAEARRTLREWIAASPEEAGDLSTRAGELESLLGEAESRRSRSPTAARWLSAFLPGSGQLYAGRPLEGLNALTVSGLSAALVVKLALDRSWPDALLLLLTLFDRFYFGNIANAGELAEDHNRRLDALMEPRILAALEELLGTASRAADVR